MSSFSEEEENELINFENLKILDLFEHDSEIDAVECFDINSGKKKIILIKMNNIEITNDDISNLNSADQKSKKSDVRKEEIHELKYNLYLGLFRDCVPAINNCEEIIKNRNLMGQRVTIQRLEILKEQKIFYPKKYIFIPPNGKKELFFEIKENIFLKISKEENIKMELYKKSGKNNEKLRDLKEFDEKTGPDIANKIITKKSDKSSGNKGSPLERSTTNNSEYIPLNNNNQQNEININFEKNNESSSSIKNESAKNRSVGSSGTGGSKLSKLDRSSENELEQGILFFDEKEKGTKYIKYSYFDSFKKEIDGIYYRHLDINLGIGRKELNLNAYKNYEDFENEYNQGDKNNDLHAYIIMKNFEEKKIPKNASFIIEIKAGFDFIKLLKQIKKAAKYVNNMRDCGCQLPKYFIGILCSFNYYNVTAQFKELKNFYNGTDFIDKSYGLDQFRHITKIIDKHNIKFVLAVIKDGKINGYDLGNEDYYVDDVDKNRRKVNLLHMYKVINNINNLKPEILETINEKIRTVIDNFSKVYETFNNELIFKITYNQKIEQEKKFKESEEKIKTPEEAKKNEDNLKIEKNKMEEERKKIEEERKKINEERKKMHEEEMKKIEEERKKMHDEMMKKIEEERKKINEERKKMHEEEMKKIEEERKKIHDEMMRKIEEERKKINEEDGKKKMEEEEKENKKVHEGEDKKAKEDRSKNEQESEYHEEKI